MTFSSRISASLGLRSVAELKPGQSATIFRVQAHKGSPLDPNALTRLGELGFLPGESVTLLRVGPGGCEPLAVQIGDTLLALRAAEALCILIEE